MNEKQKLIYLAGIVDGEGCFWRGYHTNGRGDKHYQSTLAIDNTYRPLIDWLIENYGSNAWPKTKIKPHHSDAWSWRLNGKKCEALAKKLQPYLLVKTEKVKKVLPGYPEYLI